MLLVLDTSWWQRCKFDAARPLLFRASRKRWLWRLKCLWATHLTLQFHLLVWHIHVLQARQLFEVFLSPLPASQDAVHGEIVFGRGSSIYGRLPLQLRWIRITPFGRCLRFLVQWCSFQILSASSAQKIGDGFSVTEATVNWVCRAVSTHPSNNSGFHLPQLYFFKIIVGSNQDVDEIILFLCSVLFSSYFLF